MTQPNPALEVVVLAAGQGTRMNSAMPKVLHPLAGQPLLQHVLHTVYQLEPAAVHVVVGHRSDMVCDRFADCAPLVRFVHQAEQLGTGHAVQTALPDIDPTSTVLVVFGDVPLVGASTLRAAVDAAAGGAVGLVTATFEDPAELGRIVRDAHGAIRGIVEYRDASDEQRAICEINSGIIAAGAAVLKELLDGVGAANQQNEYYLTDIIALAVKQNIPVQGLTVGDPFEVAGVNDRVQLAQLERALQRHRAEQLMQQGVTIADPERVDIRGTVIAGSDTFIDVNVVLEGHVIFGEGVRVGPGSVITNSELGPGTEVHAHTVIEGAKISGDCELGPFARIRPDTVLENGVKIGNFVEVKKSTLGTGTKANHLSYIGDSEFGAKCNVGAGTITCNYDGVAKHKTTAGDGVFVGSNSTLVAPVTLGNDSYVAAGSTVTHKVNAGDLAVGRGRQRNIEGWTSPKKRVNSDNEPDGAKTVDPKTRTKASG